MKYHYYIGLQLPPDIRSEIIRIQKELSDPIESVEPLEPHITLLPPPSVEQINSEDLAIHVKAATAPSLPCTFVLSEVMTFENHAVAIRVQSKGVHELQQQLIELLPFAAEVTYYPHPAFTPHVTLVQALRGHTLPSKLIEEYQERLTSLLPVQCEAQYLTLFEWTGPRTYKARPI